VELSAWFASRRVGIVGLGSGRVRRVGGMMAAAVLGWTRKESGMDGANSHGAGEVVQTKVYGFGVRFIVKVVEVATFNRP
jgi:hypothetical protein